MGVNSGQKLHAKIVLYYVHEQKVSQSHNLEHGHMNGGRWVGEGGVVGG